MAPSATLVGEVLVGAHVRIWYNVVARGELNSIRIGNFTSVGDSTVISASASLPPGVPGSVNIGKNVLIGHGCSIYSCIIDDDAVIGDKATVMEGARIERGAVVAPNSVVPPGVHISAYTLWEGSPVTFVRELNDEEISANYKASYEGAVTKDGVGASFALHPSLSE